MQLDPTKLGRRPTSLKAAGLAAAVLATAGLGACSSGTKGGVAGVGTTTTLTGAAGGASTVPTVPTMHAALFAKPPAGSTNPDDIVMLDGKMYVTFQNNAGKDGAPTGSKSTIAVFDPSSGQLITTYSVTGRCDGLGADPRTHQLLASVNEDSNSSLYVITPGASAPVHYSYNPDPEQKGSDGSNGGTDAITVAPDGTIYVAHSNPDPALPPPNDAAAVYTMHLSATTATLTPLYGVNDKASPLAGGQPTTMALTDPDSNNYLPNLDGGTLLQDSQGDSKLILSGPKGDRLRQLSLTNATGSSDVTPQLDDVIEVTGPGSLFVVDQSSGNIMRETMTPADTGKFFGSQPNPSTGDKPNTPALSTVNMQTGVVTPVDEIFGSPKGLLFVPSI